MEENKNALDEVNKGCAMGIEAINSLIEKVDSQDFKSVLEEELEIYEETKEKISELYDDYSEDDPHEISEFEKTMADYMMKMKTMMDHTDSKIAEMLLQGTNMGVIEGKRILNNKKLDEEVEKLLKKFVNEQEIIVEDLKKYL